MMNREQLIEATELLLDKNGYDYCESAGCFDIAARKKSSMLLKILANVDAFQQEQSNDLAILSDYLSADPFVVGVHTSTERLQNSIIYERFGTPVVTPNTLERMLFNEFPVIFRKRGGLYAFVSSVMLRKARESKKLSQSQLAKKVGISKKNIYEHEASDKPAEYGIAAEIEKVLGTRIITPPEFRRPKYRKNKAVGLESSVSSVLKKLGFSSDVIEKAQFNVVARKKEALIIGAEHNKKHAESTAPSLYEFSSVIKRPAIIVTKEEINTDIPYISLAEFAELSSRQILRRAKNS